MNQHKHMLPQIPISWGELLDKITILEIKNQKILSKIALQNIRKELEILKKVELNILNNNVYLMEYKRKLFIVNEKLWQIEERIREKEKKQEFDLEFIELARSVYKTNDCRANLKKEINIMLKSVLIEEKSYR